MDIRTEADDIDEGVGPEEENRAIPRWKSPWIKKRLLYSQASTRNF